MKTLLKSLLAVAIIGIAAQSARATEFGNDTMAYVIKYKWAFIDANAANAELALKRAPKHYDVRLTGQSMSWINYVITVADTLAGKVEMKTCLPLEYVKATHQNKAICRDTIRYERNDTMTIGHVSRWSGTAGDSVLAHSDTTLYAKGPTYDLLSIFYYIRTLDYEKMKPGTKQTVNVFSPDNVEQLTMTYVGPVTLPIGTDSYDTYHLRFTFTENGEGSGHPMLVWLDKGHELLPVRLEGVLSFGQVDAFYTGKK